MCDPPSEITIECFLFHLFNHQTPQNSISFTTVTFDRCVFLTGFARHTQPRPWMTGRFFGPEPRLHNPAMARSKEDLPVPEAPSKSKDSPVRIQWITAIAVSSYWYVPIWQYYDNMCGECICFTIVLHIVVDLNTKQTLDWYGLKSIGTPKNGFKMLVWRICPFQVNDNWTKRAVTNHTSVQDWEMTIM